MSEDNCGRGSGENSVERHPSRPRTPPLPSRSWGENLGTPSRGENLGASPRRTVSPVGTVRRAHTPGLR